MSKTAKNSEQSLSIAIVLAASEYQDSDDDLPGCRHDARAMEAILRKTGKYNKVFVEEGRLAAAPTKQALVDFLEPLKDREVAEVFFYYTGHGEFLEDDFLYVLSDYDSQKRRQTSLSNAELDNLLKQLSPGLVVKVVDACQAGVRYIKRREKLEAYVKSVGASFEDLFFMFSSKADQSSYQSAHLSDFTGAFIGAVASHASSALRYKEIIDYLQDAFEANEDQTPYFVTQADFSQKFCEMSDDLRRLAGSFLPTPSPRQAVAAPETSIQAIVERVEADARRFKSMEEAHEFLGHLKTAIEDHKWRDEAHALFSIDTEVHEGFGKAPGRASIGDWLESSKHDYFARPDYTEKTEYVDVERWMHSLTGSFPGLGGRRPEKVERTVQVVSGFSTTAKLPYHLVTVTFSPKFPNLSKARAYLLPVVSKTHLAVFHCWETYKPTSWTADAVENRSKWAAREIPLTDFQGALDHVLKVLESFWSAIDEEMLASFRQPPSTKEEPSPGSAGEQE